MLLSSSGPQGHQRVSATRVLETESVFFQNLRQMNFSFFAQKEKSSSRLVPSASGLNAAAGAPENVRLLLVGVCYNDIGGLSCSLHSWSTVWFSYTFHEIPTVPVPQRDMYVKLFGPFFKVISGFR